MARSAGADVMRHAPDIFAPFDLPRLLDNGDRFIEKRKGTVATSGGAA
jgi:hypothetical protein